MNITRPSCSRIPWHGAQPAQRPSNQPSLSLDLKWNQPVSQFLMLLIVHFKKVKTEKAVLPTTRGAVVGKGMESGLCALGKWKVHGGLGRGKNGRRAGGRGKSQLWFIYSLCSALKWKTTV